MYTPKAAEKITAHLSSKERIIRPAEALRHSFIRILQWMIRQEKCKELWKTINNFHKLINNFVTIEVPGDGSAGTPSPRTEGTAYRGDRTEGTVCPVRQARTEGVPRGQFIRYGKRVPGGQFVRYGKRVPRGPYRGDSLSGTAKLSPRPAVRLLWDASRIIVSLSPVVS